MKIVHIAPSAPYNDYWGYQDNLLPKYHAKLGHEVTMITTNTQHADGKIIRVPCADYVLKGGVRVIRLERKDYGNLIASNLASYLRVFDLLKRIQPDFIFFHGLVSSSIYDVVRYKKEIRPDCVVVQDNHLDYNIGRGTASAKDKIIRAYYCRRVRKTIAYVDRVYGVTPWRKQYAEEYFCVPPKKTDVLIMGADDEKISFTEREALRNRIRTGNQVSESDFLVVTGGKIDRKKNIHLLMEAIGGMDNVKLLVFGQVNEDVESEFNQLLAEHKNIRYVGWIDADKVYDYFFAADLVFFPGQHSVLWEQACAAKVPCVFARWEGMEHVNNGGNSDFIDILTAEGLRDKIAQLHFTEQYKEMKAVAESSATDIYLYSHIAEKSLECARHD